MGNRSERSEVMSKYTKYATASNGSKRSEIDNICTAGLDNPTDSAQKAQNAKKERFRADINNYIKDIESVKKSMGKAGFVSTFVTGPIGNFFNWVMAFPPFCWLTGSWCWVADQLGGARVKREVYVDIENELNKTLTGPTDAELQEWIKGKIDENSIGFGGWFGDRRLSNGRGSIYKKLYNEFANIDKDTSNFMKNHRKDGTCVNPAQVSDALDNGVWEYLRYDRVMPFNWKDEHYDTTSCYANTSEMKKVAKEYRDEINPDTVSLSDTSLSPAARAKLETGKLDDLSKRLTKCKSKWNARLR